MGTLHPAWTMTTSTEDGSETRRLRLDRHSALTFLQKQDAELKSLKLGHGVLHKSEWFLLVCHRILGEQKLLRRRGECGSVGAASTGEHW